MEVKCYHCGKTYTIDKRRYNEHIKFGWKFLCSMECLSKDRTRSLTYECAECGKEVVRSPSQIKSSKSGLVFCSRSCSTSYWNKNIKVGPGNPNYSDGSGSYRKRAFDNYKSECSVCGYNNKDILVVHHIDKDRSNNKKENLLIVCPTHHSEIHYGVIDIETITKKFINIG